MFHPNGLTVLTLITVSPGFDKFFPKLNKTKIPRDHIEVLLKK